MAVWVVHLSRLRKVPKEGFGNVRVFGRGWGNWRPTAGAQKADRKREQ
jgi:hypothetical protein